MGTASWDLSQTGSFNNNVRGRLIASGAHTTTTTGSNLTDGAAGAGTAVEAKAGDILTILIDEQARLVQGGGTATATLGQILDVGVSYVEISHPGTLSVCDIA